MGVADAEESGGVCEWEACSSVGSWMIDGADGICRVGDGWVGTYGHTTLTCAPSHPELGS